MIGRNSVLLLVVVTLFWSTAYAGTVLLPGLGGGFQVEVTSFKAKRFHSVLQQQYDFSCGSAALATLLSYHYGHEMTEQEVFAAMYALADADKVRQEGFSMLDMKRFLESEGYRADGFRMPLSGLRERIRLPVVALISPNGFRHFVVIKGISETEVLVGDPARGLRVYSREKFDEHWNGAAFVIRSHLGQGRASFMSHGDWPQVTRAPLSGSVQEPSLGHTLPRWPSSTDW